MFLRALFLGFLFLTSAFSWAHGGRTDGRGCHHDRKHGTGYHCHGGSGRNEPSTSSDQKHTDNPKQHRSPTAERQDIPATKTNPFLATTLQKNPVYNERLKYRFLNDIF